MVALSILGCMLMAYFFMALTAIIKGISAFLDTMVEMIEIWAILLLGGVGILIIELLVKLFGGEFWTIFWIVVGIIVVCVIFGAIIGLIGTILVFGLEVAIFALGFAYSILDLILGKLGEWSELGLKFFLGLINKQIVRS